MFRTPYPATDLIKSSIYKKNVTDLLNHKNKDTQPIKEGTTAIGHSRLVTNGYEQFNENNQPVVKNNIVGIHNGIVVNEKELWQKYSDEQRVSQLDSELILTLLRRFFVKRKSLKAALKETFSEIYGMASIALLFKDLNNLLLATNNGSLYYVRGNDSNSLVFASEYYILKSLLAKNFIIFSF